MATTRTLSDSTSREACQIHDLGYDLNFYCRYAAIESDPIALPRAAESGAPLHSALAELLAGPSPDEESRGFYHSIFFPETAGMLKEVLIKEDGAAVVDFAPEVKTVNNISTSGAGNQVFRSLAFTIFQFPSVQTVTYRIAGDRHAWCNLFEITCDSPSITRAQFEDMRGR